MVGGCPAYDICGCTNQPRAAISSHTVKGSHVPSVASATRVESGVRPAPAGRRSVDAGHDRVDGLEGVRARAVRSRRRRCSYDRPGAGQRAAGPGRLHGGVEHRVAGPVGPGEELRTPQRRVAVQQHRGALGGVGVLVQVDRDRGDPRHREGPRRHRAAEPGGVRQHPAADAGVDVAAHPALGGGRGQLGDGVDHAVGVRRRARPPPAPWSSSIAAAIAAGVGAEVRRRRGRPRCSTPK